MSKYLYTCKNCFHVHEEDFSILGDIPKTLECPECGEVSHRRFSVPYIHYRGSGFTHTDTILDEPENPLDIDD